VFNKSKDVKGLSDILNWYQNSFIKLADALFYSSDISRILATQALILIVGLTRHTQEQYRGLLDSKQPLPIFEARELSQKVDAELIVIQKGLHEKHISVPLIEQVVKAHTDLFKPTKYPALCYSEKEYVEIFLPQLKALADDNREKDWNGRIRQLLIKYNFNHMGVYKFLESEIEKNFSSLRKPEDWLSLLYDKSIWIEQIMEVPDLAYTANHESLKQLLLKYLNAKGEFMKERLKIGKLIQPSKFYRNVNVNELALDLHYRFYENEFGYKTKKEAAAAFCESNSGKETVNISPHSINKFDKLEQHDAAVKLYQRYQRIVSKLAKDFDLKFW
jgi:hypothetical protein